MAKVEEISTESQNEDADAAEALSRYTGPPVPGRKQAPFLSRVQGPRIHRHTHALRALPRESGRSRG